MRILDPNDDTGQSLALWRRAIRVLDIDARIGQKSRDGEEGPGAVGTLDEQDVALLDRVFVFHQDPGRAERVIDDQA